MTSQLLHNGWYFGLIRGSLVCLHIGPRCTVCRFQNSKWYTLYDCIRPVYHINDFVLPLSDAIRDLGIIVDSNLKFDKHVSATVHEAHIRANLILRCFTSRYRKLLVKAFCTYVLIIIPYTSIEPQLQVFNGYG